MAVNNSNNSNNNCYANGKPTTTIHNSRRRHTSLTPVTSVTAAAASNATNRRYSLDQTNESSIVYCEGYARIKRRNVLTWTTRFLVLTHTNLLLFHNKQDATYRRNVVESLLLKSGRVSPKNDLTIEFTLADGREVLGRVFSRADQFQWITAFYQLAMTSEVVRRPKSASMDAQDPKKAAEKRHVSFFGSVKVRTIPTLPDDQVLELFYSKQDVEKFSAQATSLRTRTEDAVSLVFHKPLLAWRRQLV